MTDKSNEWSVDFDDWGHPILDKYAVAVVNLDDDQTMGLARPDHLRSSTQLLTSDEVGGSNWHFRDYLKQTNQHSP
jgi:hypothetical protein